MMIKDKYNSRANAPTGSAGEESVSWCWVVVVVVVDVVVVVARCFVDTHARRARARAKHAPKNGLIWREPAHMRKGGSGAHKLS